MTKVLKAFACQVKGCDGPDIIHAITASKARYDLWRNLEWDDLEFGDISVRRAPESDMVFPDMPELAGQIDENNREVIINAFGGGSHIPPKQWGYRDHFCCDPKDGQLNRLVELGLFRGPYGPTGKGEASVWAGAFFYLTDAGKTMALALIGDRECITAKGGKAA
jgi:hypothetical protein